MDSTITNVSEAISGTTRVITDEEREIWMSLLDIAQAMQLKKDAASSLRDEAERSICQEERKFHKMFTGFLSDPNYDKARWCGLIQGSKQKFDENRATELRDMQAIDLDCHKLWNAYREQAFKLSDLLMTPPLFACSESLLQYKTPEAYLSRQDPSGIWHESTTYLVNHGIRMPLGSEEFSADSVINFANTFMDCIILAYSASPGLASQLLRAQWEALETPPTHPATPDVSVKEETEVRLATLAGIITDEEREIWMSLLETAHAIRSKRSTACLLRDAAERSRCRDTYDFRVALLGVLSNPVHNMDRWRGLLQESKQKFDEKRSRELRDLQAIDSNCHELWNTCREQAFKLSGLLMTPPLFACSESLLQYMSPEAYLMRQDPTRIWHKSTKYLMKCTTRMSLSSAEFSAESVINLWTTLKDCYFLAEYVSPGFVSQLFSAEGTSPKWASLLRTAQWVITQARPRDMTAPDGLAGEETEVRQRTEIENQTIEPGTTLPGEGTERHRQPANVIPSNDGLKDRSGGSEES